MIPRRPLGATGLAIPILGFGASGPHGAPVTSRRLTVDLLRAAIDAGAGLIDTAPFYGDAEIRVGEALKDADRSAAFVITKAGKRVDDVRRADLAPEAVRASCLRSRDRLRIERIDALLLHGPDPEGLTPALRDGLERLLGDGVIRTFGVCGRGGEVAAALERGFAPVVMCPLGGGAAASAAAAGAGLIAIETLRASAPGWRAPRSTADLWYLARRLARGGPKPSGLSPPQALRDALAAPGVAAAIVTTTRRAHLQELVAAVQPP